MVAAEVKDAKKWCPQAVDPAQASEWKSIQDQLQLLPALLEGYSDQRQEPGELHCHVIPPSMLGHNVEIHPPHTPAPAYCVLG